MPRYREWDLTCKVYVGNLDQRATKHQIEDIFSKYGPLRNVWVARNPPGFAFVEYEDNRDAEDAVRNLDGSRACGSRIRVEMSNGRTRHDGRRGGGDRGDRRREERGGQRTRYRLHQYHHNSLTSSTTSLLSTLHQFRSFLLKITVQLYSSLFPT
ncbi:RNA-binding protein 1-like isoform X1 [Chironomus tepperi]|uniref:RNA-binding protein 1-like isoform X1 n=1 Tax=Chironomus tepperi TaxID=113505 RepID=UPI00391F0469